MYAGLTDLTAHTIAAWFVRLFLWLCHKQGLRCRQCETVIPIPDVARFVSEGCLACGEKKLRFL